MAFSRWRLSCEKDGSLTKEGEELSVTLKAGRGCERGRSRRELCVKVGALGGHLH